MTSLDAVVFDMGGVLVDWDREHLYRKLVPDAEERRRVLDEVVTLEWNATLDRGRSFDAAIEELTRLHPGDADLIAAFRDRWPEMIPSDLPDTVEIVKELHSGGVRLLGLTNWAAATWPHAEARFAWLELFEGIVVSGQEGISKPDPAIFGLLCERYDLDPGRSLFVDDSPTNVAAASELGFGSVLFTCADTLRSELVGRGTLSD